MECNKCTHEKVCKYKEEFTIQERNTSVNVNSDMFYLMCSSYSKKYEFIENERPPKFKKYNGVEFISQEYLKWERENYNKCR